MTTEQPHSGLESLCVPASRRPGGVQSPIGRPSYILSDIWKAPLHDFPIRDEILCQYLPLEPAMDLLEIGPGSGLTAFRLSRKVRHLTLVDVSAGNIRALEQRLAGVANVRLVCADAGEPELARQLGNTFDAVYGLEVFAYIRSQQNCLRNIAGVLRLGGQLLVQFPNYRQANQHPQLNFFQSREEIDWLFQKAGFTEWNVWALQLRPYARFLFQHFARRPLLLYRRWNKRREYDHAVIYEQTWAFQHHNRLERLKPFLHGAWVLLSAVLRAGGDSFERTPLEADVRNRNLLVIARR
jgi:SAM-dependent methyltransferase